MCTVTYLPLSKGQYILTSNRDEAPSRATAELETKWSATGSLLHFPKDPLSGGSWMCSSKDGRSLCLLNGAFEKHAHQPPYRRSRGLVVLDFFDWPRAVHFFEQYDCNGIEPFTIVCCEAGQLHEFRWDGEQSYYKQLDALKPYIWSSATLYTPYYQTLRARLFETWLEEQPTFETQAILRFHQSSGVGDDRNNDFIMNRQNRVCTVSITSIEKRMSHCLLEHRDLLSRQTTRKQFEITTSIALAKD